MKRNYRIVLILLGFLFILGLWYKAYFNYPITSNYSKRLFDPNRKFDSISYYPSKFTDILLNIKENDLVGIRCTDYYGRFDPDKPLTNSKKEKMQNFAMQSLAGRLQNFIDKSNGLSALGVCKTEDGHTFISYNLAERYQAGGFNHFSLNIHSYFAEEKNFNIIPIVKLSDSEGCSILEVSKSYVYTECGSGDGPVIHEGLYKIDIVNKKVELLKECTVDFSILFTPPEWSCK